MRGTSRDQSVWPDVRSDEQLPRPGLSLQLLKVVRRLSRLVLQYTIVNNYALADPSTTYVCVRSFSDAKIEVGSPMWNSWKEGKRGGEESDGLVLSCSLGVRRPCPLAADVVFKRSNFRPFPSKAPRQIRVKWTSNLVLDLVIILVNFGVRWPKGSTW
jgi:hypothetical protein